MHQIEIEQVSERCKSVLNLADAHQVDEFQYGSLPLCVIDTVFSIGVRYSSTEKVVERFCTYFGIPRLSKSGVPATSQQMPISEFCASYVPLGIEGMARDVYRNWQRTSTRNGLLNYFQDVERILGEPVFEADIQAIPGQRSGISLRYFYMLAGSSAYIKPDRMVERFVRAAIGRTLGVSELHTILLAVCKNLTEVYPRLTPRALDHAIWSYQRQQPLEQ